MDIIISSSKESEKAMVMRLIKYASGLMADSEKMNESGGDSAGSDTSGSDETEG